MRRLRVAYLAPSLIPGGAERQMLSLAERLPRDRFAVEFVVLNSPGVYSERAKAAGIPIRTVSLALPPKGWLPARLRHRASKATRYAAIMRTGRYDIIDAWLYPADVLAALMRPLTRTPVIITGRRNIDPQRFFGPFERTVASLVVRLTDVIVANSDAVALNAVRTGGVSPDQIRVIRNGVESRLPVTAAERQASRNALGIAHPDSIVIGCVANYLPVKRHDMLIEAFAALPDRDGMLRLVLVGEGPLRGALERQVTELRLGDRVRLHGSELDPEPVYAAFDIVVQASSREGLPNALLEAGGAGRAIVATAAGGSGEIVSDGETGLLVPVDDKGALATALGRLISDPQLRERLGAAARERITSAFGMDRFVAEFAQLYEDQAQRRNARR